MINHFREGSPGASFPDLENIELEREWDQVMGFVRGTGEVGKARLINKLPHINGIQVTAIVGMLSLIPDIVHESGILKDRDLILVINALIDCQVGMNDFYDYQAIENPNTKIKDSKDEAQEYAERTKDRLSSLLHRRRDEGLTAVITEYLRELECIENTARERAPMDLEHAIQYRELVNAISTIVLVAAILGPEKLQTRMKFVNFDSDDPYRTIVDNYRWVTNPGRIYDDPLERAIIAMFNMSMAAQCDDDREGAEIDRILNAQSMFLAAERELGSRKRAIAYIERRKFDYHSRARDFGLSHISSRSMALSSRMAQKSLHGGVSMARGVWDWRIWDWVRLRGTLQRILSKYGSRREGDLIRGILGNR